MDNMPLAAVILNSIPEAFIINMVGLTLSGIPLKQNINKLILIGIISSIFSFIIRGLPIPFGVHTLLTIPFVIALLKFCLGISFKQGSLVFMLGLIVQIMVEIIYTPIVSLVLNQSLTEIINDPFLRIVVPYPYLLFLFIVSFYIDKKGISIFPIFDFIKTKIFSVKYLIIILVLIMAILIGLININLLLVQNNNVQSTEISFNIHILSIFILISMVLALYLTKKLFESAVKEIETESQVLFLKNVNDLFLTLRSQRHDFLNHVHTLNGLLSINKYDLAKRYAADLLKDTVELNDVIKLKEPFLAALLRSKLAFADSLGVNLKIKADSKITKFTVNSFELNKILGNLLDNAIEAVKISSVEHSEIIVSIRQLDQCYVFEVSNYCKSSDAIYKDKIFEPNYTKKEGHSGIGLTIVKQLVEKNKGTISVNYHEEVITFVITLPK